MIGSHPEIGMLSEDTRHVTKHILGTKVWGNKLCVPNQITLNPPPDPRSVWRRLEDGIRAVLGQPRYHASYPAPRYRYTIRTYVGRGAYLVATIRDPDQVIDSMLRRGGLSEADAKTRWSRAVRILHEVYAEYGERTCLIRFADLVQQPKEAMGRICGLLDLPYSSQMLEEGPGQTPQYDNEGIDTTKVSRDVTSYHMDAFDPKAFKMYTDLTEQANALV
jgi:hypothetical protein